MKVGILAVRTLNYGSLLQSYATQEIVKSMGHEVEIIAYKKTNVFKQAKRLLYFPMLQTQLRVLYKKLYLCLNKELKKYFNKKYCVMNDFISSNFISSEVYLGRKELIKHASDYDVFVLGSDQVWNPLNFGADYFSMSWIPDGISKVTYAASFGVSELPKYQIKKTSNDLKRIDSISVREKSAQKLIKKLIDRDVPVVADPTILLDRIHWDNIRGERLISQKYIMCYFLGTNEEHRKTATLLSQATNLPIVTLPHGDEIVKADFGFGDILPESVGPAEFVNLISNADYVCTDSFHGTVFSILYHRNFIAFKRYKEGISGTESTNSRITLLLHTLGLEHRLFDSALGLNEAMLQRIDYSGSDIMLKNLRKTSQDYLMDALSKSQSVEKGETV